MRKIFSVLTAKWFIALAGVFTIISFILVLIKAATPISEIQQGPEGIDTIVYRGTDYQVLDNTAIACSIAGITIVVMCCILRGFMARKEFYGKSTKR